jgi:hypothetical protein
VNEANLGPELERFEATAAWFRAEALLRVVASVIALLAACATLLGSLPIGAFLVALTGGLVGLAWFFAAKRGLKRSAQAGNFSLTVHPRGLVFCEGTTRAVLPFAEITAIYVDEDRLDVVIERTSGEPVRIEPRYPGVEIHELMHRLRNAWRGGSDC